MQSIDNPMKVSVFGAGYVGLVSAAGLAAIGHQVVCIDVDAERVERLMLGEVPFYEPGLSELVTDCVKHDHLRFTTSSQQAVEHGEVLMIGVGTPPLLDGSADLSQVINVAQTIGALINHFAVIVIKSTVPVGTSEIVHQAVADAVRTAGTNIEFAVASNPEFLKEGDAVQDFMKPDRIVGASDTRAIQLLTAMYLPLCSTPDVLMVMSEKSSELCKYASNAMLATRISFMNEIAKLSDAVGADVIDIQRVMAADPRIGAKYLGAGAGFGGSCFPKDLRAIVAMGNDNDMNLNLIKSVIEVNDAQQNVLLDKALQHFGSLKGKRCAIWGLSFKPETDDIRDAPALTLIRRLLAEGATVVAHDPLVKWLPMFSSIAPSLFEIVDCQYAAVVDADVLFLVTEWKQFRDLNIDRLVRNMRECLIIDGRNLWHELDFSNTPITYVGIGRSSQDSPVNLAESSELRKLVS
jgi:UDPglucose 6-dehydrogenase